MGYSLEDQPGTMKNRDGWQERVCVINWMMIIMIIIIIIIIIMMMMTMMISQKMKKMQI